MELATTVMQVAAAIVIGAVALAGLVTALDWLSGGFWE